MYCREEETPLVKVISHSLTCLPTPDSDLFHSILLPFFALTKIFNRNIWQKKVISFLIKLFFCVKTIIKFKEQWIHCLGLIKEERSVENMLAIHQNIFLTKKYRCLENGLSVLSKLINDTFYLKIHPLFSIEYKIDLVCTFSTFWVICENLFSLFRFVFHFIRCRKWTTVEIAIISLINDGSQKPRKKEEIYFSIFLFNVETKR